jgi:hypothetical protein
MVHHEVQQRGIADRRSVKVLAGHGRADHRKDPRPDHRANAERGQRPRPQRLAQGVAGFFRIPDQFIDRLAG